MPVESQRIYLQNLHIFSCFLKIMLFPIVSQNSGLLFAVNWPFTWRQFHFANFDRPILLFSWKVADGVLFLWYSPWVAKSPPACLPSCSECTVLAPVVMFRYSPMSPVLLLRHVFFGFNRDELRVLPRVYLYILNACKFCILLPRNDSRFRSLQPDTIPVIESVKAWVKFHPTVFSKHQDCSPSSFVHSLLGR